jgi:hypothetical protein
MGLLPQANSAIVANIQRAVGAASFERIATKALPAVKRQISDMALKGSGIRATARGLGRSPTTVIEAFKKPALATSQGSGASRTGTLANHCPALSGRGFRGRGREG